MFGADTFCARIGNQDGTRGTHGGHHFEERTEAASCPGPLSLTPDLRKLVIYKESVSANPRFIRYRTQGTVRREKGSPAVAGSPSAPPSLLSPRACSSREMSP